MDAREIVEMYCIKLYDSHLRDKYIAIARQSIDAGFFGTNYEEAVALMASHKYSLNVERPGEAGVVTYKAEGRRMVSLGGIGVLRDELELTNYGRQLIGLANRNMMPITVASSFAIDVLLEGDTSGFIPCI